MHDKFNCWRWHQYLFFFIHTSRAARGCGRARLAAPQCKDLYAENLSDHSSASGYFPAKICMPKTFQIIPLPQDIFLQRFVCRKPFRSFLCLSIFSPISSSYHCLVLPLYNIIYLDLIWFFLDLLLSIFPWLAPLNFSTLCSPILS